MTKFNDNMEKKEFGGLVGELLHEIAEYELESRMFVDRLGKFADKIDKYYKNLEEDNEDS